jgi:hypothetical protein
VALGASADLGAAAEPGLPALEKQFQIFRLYRTALEWLIQPVAARKAAALRYGPNDPAPRVVARGELVGWRIIDEAVRPGCRSQLRPGWSLRSSMSWMQFARVVSHRGGNSRLGHDAQNPSKTLMGLTRLDFLGLGLNRAGVNQARGDSTQRVVLRVQTTGHVPRGWRYGVALAA